jgi:hypothetical protein
MQPGTGGESGTDGLDGPAVAALPAASPRQGEELQPQPGRGQEQARQGARPQEQVIVAHLVHFKRVFLRGT